MHRTRQRSGATGQVDEDHEMSCELVKREVGEIFWVLNRSMFSTIMDKKDARNVYKNLDSKDQFLNNSKLLMYSMFFNQMNVLVPSLPFYINP